MRSLLALLIGLWVICASAPAQAVILMGHTVVVSACAQDGSSGAPAGATITFPTWKSSVNFPPPCAVADVDYGVGPPAGTVFKDPRLDPPAGSTPYYAPQNSVFCEDGATVVWDGYDFTLDGGTNLLIKANCAGYTIKNSKFKKGVNCPNGPKSLSGGGAIIGIVKNNDFDGGGSAAVAYCTMAGIDNGEMVQLLNDGTKEVKYNRFHDVDQHFITYGGANSIIDEAYNSFYDCGFEQGGHCNAHQFSNTNGVTSIQWDFFYDPQPTEAWTTLAGNATFVSGQNTVAILLPDSNQGSFRVGQHLTSSKITGTAVVCNVNDPTGPPGGPDTVTLTLDTTDTTCTHPANATSSGATTATIPDMWPIGKVIDIRYVNDGGSASLNGGTFSHNTFAGPGPIMGTTYAINCEASIGPFVASGNYWSPANYSGSLFNVITSTGGGHVVCSADQRSGSGNIRTDTGATTPVP